MEFTLLNTWIIKFSITKIEKFPHLLGIATPLLKGMKLSAIKEIMEIYNISIKDAKSICEEIINVHWIGDEPITILLIKKSNVLNHLNKRLSNYKKVNVIK